MSDTASSIADYSTDSSDDSESVNSGIFSSPVKAPTRALPGRGGNGCGGVMGRIPPSLAPSHRLNVVQKLYRRQLYGKVKERSKGPEMRLFSRLPGRLAFLIRDVVPQSALISGHVFLGFSGCGQYLLSYTQTTTDTDISDLNFNYYYRLHWWVFVPYSKARKVAEVTLFTNQGVYGNLSISVCQWPGDQKRLVIYGHQTHDPDSDEVVAGSQHCYLTVTNAPSLDNCSQCTQVASSYDADDVAAAWNSCVRLSCLQHGATVHTEFDLVPPYPKFEPKISLKRAGCVVINTGNFLHSVTVDLERLGSSAGQEEQLKPNVYSYNPSIGGYGPSLGTGYGSLGYESETAVPSTHEHSTFRGINPLSPLSNPISVNVGTAEFTLGADGSPGGFSPASFPPCNSDSENTDVESEASSPSSRSLKKLKVKRPLRYHCDSCGPPPRPDLPGSCRAAVADMQNYRDRLDKVHEFTEKLSPCRDKDKQREEDQLREQRREERDKRRKGADQEDEQAGGGFQFTVPPTPATCERKRKLADAAYDFQDENFADVDVPEKLSTFRRKRLAEKKYEFTEEEEENERPMPITRLRSKKAEEAGGDKGVLSQVLAGRSTGDLMVCVSERISTGEEDLTDAKEENERSWTDMLDGAAYPELFSPGGCIKKDANSMSPRLHQSMMSPKVMSSAISPRAANPEFYCKAKFTRRYIEVDDELISVITDVEDDDLGATTGFHSALPLEVHGSGYTQMQMISNSKAEKLNLDCVRVQQRSLDLEQFCHETATRLCAAAHKKFWFCNDYDVEVIDVDPTSGDVVVVAVVLIQAAILTKAQSTKFNVSSLSRKQYQATFKFCWNVDTGQYYVVDSDPLKEINGFKEQGVQWNPARHASSNLVKTFNCQISNIKCLTNESVISGVSLKAIVDPDNLVALIMNDLE